MARIRTVKPEFWEDETIGGLSRDARLMFLATFNLADDEGILRWAPAYIKSSVFIYDDDLTHARVQTLMAELERSRLVLPYTIGKDKQRLAWVVNFRKHQVINRPQKGKLPPPSLTNPQTLAAYMRRDNFECQLCHGPVNTVPKHDVNPYGGEPGLECLNASLDHIEHQSKGGTDHPTNIRLTHIGCNKGRQDRDDSQFQVPPSVSRALAFLIEEALRTHGDLTEDSLNTHGGFSEQIQPETPLTSPNGNSVNTHGTLTEPSWREGKGRGREGEREPYSPPSYSPPAKSPKIQAHRIVNTWLEGLEKRPPTKSINDALSQIILMVQDGIAEEHMIAGLTDWWDGNYPPSTIPNYVRVHVRGTPARNNGQAPRATGEDRALNILAINGPEPDDEEYLGALPSWDNVK